MSATGTDEALRRSQVRRALVARTVGTSIEWYDFFLYGTAAALVFPKLFFPGASNYAGVLASLAAAAMNPSVVSGDHADVHLERTTVRWLAELVGYPHVGGGGLFTSGASAAPSAG